MNIEGGLERFRRELSQIFAIALKDFRIYYASPPMIMFGLFMQFFMFFSFSVRRGLAGQEALSRLLAITTFFTASSTGPVVLPMEKRTRTFERLLVAPVSRVSVLLGKALVGVGFGMFVSLLVLGVATALWRIVPSNWILFVLSLILSCLVFSLMGVAFGSWPTSSSISVGNIMMPSTLLRWPLLFISGVFVPLEQMSPLLRGISYISPLTYVQDLMNHTILSQGVQAAALDWTLLLLFALWYP